MNEVSGLMPAIELEEVQSSEKVQRKAPVQTGPSLGSMPGFKGIITGFVVLAAALVMLYLGWGWFTGVKETTAVVHTATEETPSWAKRGKATATYTVGMRTYPLYPGVRGEGSSFTVYYLPSDPATGYEARPFLWLVIGGKVLLVGLAILAFSVMRFVVNRVQVMDHERSLAQAG